MHRSNNTLFMFIPGSLTLTDTALVSLDSVNSLSGHEPKRKLTDNRDVGLAPRTPLMSIIFPSKARHDMRIGIHFDNYRPSMTLCMYFFCKVEPFWIILSRSGYFAAALDILEQVRILPGSHLPSSSIKVWSQVEEMGNNLGRGALIVQTQEVSADATPIARNTNTRRQENSYLR